MRIVSVVNQKGGCGKTTVAINLAAALKERGNRVLLIDMDPQAHASLSIRDTGRDAIHTTYDLLINPKLRLSEAIHEISDTFGIIPASPTLSALEQELAYMDGRESRLGSKLARAKEDYDFVIIDSPPNVGILTFNALVASKEVLIPIEPSYFSLKGLERLTETLELLEEETDHKVSMHILINNIEKRTNFSRDFVLELERKHESILMNGTVSHSVRYKETAQRGISIFEGKNCDRLRREFLEIAEEIESRGPKLEIEDIRSWMTRLHGPKVLKEGVLFSFNAPNAKRVCITGEFANWSGEGIPMAMDSGDGLWKATLDLEPGEYEYRFIVDGVWLKDPKNSDTVMNEFGQENSLLIV